MAGQPDRSGTFSIADVAFGEALIAVSAHLDTALAIYQRGDAATALVHANRSLESMPRISRDMWRYNELATALNQAAAAVSSAIRGRRPETQVGAARDAYDDLSARAVGTVVGEPAASPGYRASVVVALLRTAAAASEAGIHDDARGLVARARSLVGTLWGGAISPEEVDRAFESLSADPGDIRGPVAAIAGALHDSFDALVDLEPGPREILDRVAELLEGALEAVAAGDLFRADKLVGQAYVEGYARVRPALQGWSSEAELDDLVGSLIRRAVAAGEPVDDLISRAGYLLAAAPL